MRRVTIHKPGLIYVGVLAVIALAAMNNQNNLLFWLFGVMASALIVSWILATLMLRGIEIRRLDPRHGMVGEPLTVRYMLRNRARLLPAFDLHVEEVPEPGKVNWPTMMTPARAWVMHVGPRDHVHGEAVLWPTRRGTASFGRLKISTSFPLGIIRRTRIISQPQHTLIHPRLYELRRVLLSAVSPIDVMGTRISQHAGAGDDYYGMREYRPGDSLRHVSWKRTARLDQLVTIERTSPSPSRLRVTLDLSLHTERSRSMNETEQHEQRDLEERAISLAASIIHASDIAGFEIGLRIVGVPMALIPVRRSQWHVRKMMAALAAIDLDAPRTPASAGLSRESERAGQVVVVPDRIHPTSGDTSAMYLTARQLESLAVRPIGWSERERHRTHEKSALEKEAAA